MGLKKTVARSGHTLSADFTAEMDLLAAQRAAVIDDYCTAVNERSIIVADRLAALEAEESSLSDLRVAIAAA